MVMENFFGTVYERMLMKCQRNEINIKKKYDFKIFQ